MNLFVTKQKQVKCGDKTYPCAIGRSGFIPAGKKEEGDGATPTGQYQLHKIFYRPDKVKCPKAGKLPVHKITPHDGWCDDPNHASYNQHIKMPFEASHEHLWRSDDIYNIVIEISHNQEPSIPRKGSAIFLHVARKNYTPTKGCIALSQENLEEVLNFLDEQSHITIVQA
jgi:L,D-peptidoglycan transpeptidase YkuD (ErfK/YbiS/YcfS/YnhG family)